MFGEAAPAWICSAEDTVKPSLLRFPYGSTKHTRKRTYLGPLREKERKCQIRVENSQNISQSASFSFTISWTYSTHFQPFMTNFQTFFPCSFKTFRQNISAICNFPSQYGDYILEISLFFETVIIHQRATKLERVEVKGSFPDKFGGRGKRFFPSGEFQWKCAKVFQTPR